ncbi:MAG: hypothetical protein V1490_03040 [Candidatus Omnitrophota bacterium]
MARLLVIMGMGVIFIFAGLGYAEAQLTITTYYPSPYGSYNQLWTNSLGVGDKSKKGTFPKAPPFKRTI